MIAITRLDGSTLVVNADLIETIEHTGDTVVSLVSGNRFVVRESVSELIDAVIGFRSSVLLSAEQHANPLVVAPPGTDQPAGGEAHQNPEPGKVIPMNPARKTDNKAE